MKLQLLIFNVLYFSFLYWLIGCTPSAEQRKGYSAEESEVHQFLENYYQTMSARDWSAYAEFFIPGATLTTVWQADGDSLPGITTYSISQFIAQTGAGPDSQPIFEERMIDADITIRHDLAQAWVKYEAKFGSEEHLTEWRGTDLFSFIRFEGEWKIVSLVFATENSGQEANE